MPAEIVGAPSDPFVREALLQQGLGADVRCNVCRRRCLIHPNHRGWCRTRENRGGKLFTSTYGALSSVSADPIEKKPFYHFLPGTEALTAGSWACNFGCPWCQNWEITKGPVPTPTRFVSPEQFVGLAEDTNCRVVSLSFNEPTLSLEWALDVFSLARARHMFNVFVSNGYMTPEALALLITAGLDAINIDIKGDPIAVRKFCRGVDVEMIWETCKLALSHRIHLELVTLIIPGVNDSNAILGTIAGRIAADLGRDIPWHLAAYYPAYRFAAQSTPPATLQRAFDIARAAGLHYVYIGNVPGHRRSDTLCPQCRMLLVRRLRYDVQQLRVKAGHCPACGHEIKGVWNYQA